MGKTGVTWRTFKRFWRWRTLVVSPWTLLFRWKVLKWVLVVLFAYWILPDFITRPVDKAIEPVWSFSRKVAAELGLFKLVGHGVDGIQGGVDLIRGPDEVENSPGGKVFYAGMPVAASMDLLGKRQGAMWFRSGNLTLACERFDVETLSRIGAPNTLIPSGNVPVEGRADLRRVWTSLMEKLRKDVEDHDVLWLVTGQDGDAFCIVIDEKGGETRAQAFMIHSNAKDTQRLSTYLSTIDEIEVQYGINVLPELPEKKQRKLESKRETWAW